jgi:2-keto-4-pentenoate hydratase/2-oxohepta-3-ene-1,7-dioic acid hydratase in catechol pathway
MKLCRYDDDRIGVVVDDATLLDVTESLDAIPAVRWPVPLGDLLIRNLTAVRARIAQLMPGAKARAVSDVCLKSPIANPTKIIGAPVNYREHAEEAQGADLKHGHDIKPIGDWGLFLKANSALVGAGEGVKQRFEDRRNDHEAELAVIIGRQGSQIPRARAFDYIAGYAIGLDMTVRGPQFQCFRKSIDTYAVLGPWMVTADELTDPGDLDFQLAVNGELRQQSNTRYLIFDIAQLIEFAASYYTLYPGDIIMTGTPAGVGPVKVGDTMFIEFSQIGSMTVKVNRSSPDGEARERGRVD